MPIEKFLSKIEPFWDKSVTREVGWGEEELRAAAGVTGAVRRAAATSQQFVSGYSVVSLPERFNSRCWRGAARNTNLHWNAVMEGVIRISHLIELVYSQKIPKKLVKKILWYYLVTIPNYV